MTGERRTLKLSCLVVTARGHRVVVYTWLSKGSAHWTEQVVHDEATGAWYGGSMDLIQLTRGRGGSTAARWVLQETLVGRVLALAVRVDVQAGPSTELELEIHEAIPGDAGLRQAQRHALACDHAEVYSTSEGLEQVWPTGARHRIVWSEPFQVALHRSPLAQVGAPVMDVHLRLTQRREGSTSTLALTLALTPTPELGALPALEELHGRVTGAEARWLMDTVRYYAKMHGLDLV